MAPNKKNITARQGQRERISRPAIFPWPSPGLAVRIFLLAALISAGGFLRIHFLQKKSQI